MTRLLAAAVFTTLTACAALDVPVVTESYVTERDRSMNIDSVVTHAGSDSETWLFATAKDTHEVRVYNAADGTHRMDVGGPGTEPGRFQRPNGVLATDGMLIVIERDNHRVQLLNLPDLESVAIFGETELIKPYGAYLQDDGAAGYRLFVTDAYETAEETVPPPEELDRRIHVFDLRIERKDDGKVIGASASHALAFGATEGPGVLYVVESLWGDPDYDRLLIAEEDPAGGRVIKVYSLDGRYTGPTIGDGVFRAQPEGIALYRCPDGSGYWITTDQDRGRNIFHLFDRESLMHVGGFAGDRTRNTDGISLAQQALPGFPEGAFFAVHDDRAVGAFDWRDIRQTLDLRPACAPG